MVSSNTNTIQILEKKYLNTFKYKYKCIWPHVCCRPKFPIFGIFWFSSDPIFIIYITCTPSFKWIHPGLQNADQLQTCCVFMLDRMWKFSLGSLCIAKFQLNIKKKNIFVLGVLKHIKNKKICHELFLAYFHSLLYAIPYTNLHTKFQMNPSICVESKANTNVHSFHAKKCLLATILNFWFQPIFFPMACPYI